MTVDEFVLDRLALDAVNRVRLRVYPELPTSNTVSHEVSVDVRDLLVTSPRWNGIELIDTENAIETEEFGSKAFGR